MAKRRKGRRAASGSVRRPSARPAVSGYQSVWMFALFDLPVATQPDRKAYTSFRRLLLNEGFSMLQFSVYARWYRSEESAEADRGLIRAHLPPDGQVRLLMVTDRQFGKMDIFYGKIRRTAEEQPKQLLLF